MKFDEVSILRDINERYYITYHSDEIDRVKGEPYALIWGYRNHAFYPKRWGKAKGLEFLKQQIREKMDKEIREAQKFTADIENL